MITPNQPQTAAAVAQHYDDLDGYYRELWGEHVHHGYWKTGRETPDQAVLQLIDAVADAAQVGPGDRVCDVGCGYGGTARRLATQRGAQVVGLTISSAQHAFAVQQTPGDNPVYLLRNWLQNELADDSFDALVSIECLSHVEDKAAFFSEIRRVLQPGRKAALAVWLAKEDPRPWEVKRLLEPICREGRLTSLGSDSEYRELMAGAGLELVSFANLSREVRKTWRICAWRLAKGLASNRSYRQDLFQRRNRNWIFAVTLCRILTAFRTGSMQYGLYVVQKPPLAS
ncbi:class I SAM-dependent methyltransferase [Lignipirellula cremea]|uniref:Demethylrebeccamycin-D-glucose O-methyltransferase n=1 Tax=Lignipirellula cremea TaxID=2528010 RepID=A0A518DSM4_9BACT|nr:class I SAM-dependent methyltransferase [Lignipirellula cremea]QDU94842.1 Demethylrebeccamycin-D-glucose O-methyltransferase [Lignipirellula cremea]